MIKEELINCTVEALILASPEPVSIKRLCDTLEEVSPARVRQAIDDLNNIYLGCGSSFRIREIAGGYQVHILPDFEQPVKKLLRQQRAVRISRAALETLAIIAYKQPVTKVEIEHIRGVASDGVLHSLLQRRLILIAGRAETPGRALLYKTSSDFLKFFGLNRLSDLPRLDEIEEMIRQAEPPREQTVLPFNGKEPQAGEPSDQDSDSSAFDDDDDLAVTVDVPDGDSDAENGETRPGRPSRQAGEGEFPDEVELSDDDIGVNVPPDQEPGINPEIALDDDDFAEAMALPPIHRLQTVPSPSPDESPDDAVVDELVLDDPDDAHDDDPSAPAER